MQIINGFIIAIKIKQGKSGKKEIPGAFVRKAELKMHMAFLNRVQKAKLRSYERRCGKLAVEIIHKSVAPVSCQGEAAGGSLNPDLM